MRGFRQRMAADLASRVTLPSGEPFPSVSSSSSSSSSSSASSVPLGSLTEEERLEQQQQSVPTFRDFQMNLTEAEWSTVCVRRMSNTLRGRSEQAARKPKPSRISKVQFSILGEEELVRQSRVHVTPGSVYDRNEPRTGGLNDHRMGVVDRRMLCATCGHGIATCPGHPGHLRLGMPVYHPGMIDSVARILRCVCFFCSSLLLKPDDPKLKTAVDASPLETVRAERRFEKVTNAAKAPANCRCPNPECRAPQPKYTMEMLNLRTDWSPSAQSRFESQEEGRYAMRPFTAFRARQILAHIPQADLDIMGLSSLSHPKNSVITVMPIPPPPVRPSIMAYEGSRTRGADDLTNKLHEIQKCNRHLCDAIAKYEKETGQAFDPYDADADIRGFIADLQMEIASYIDDRYANKNARTGQAANPAQMRGNTSTKSLKRRIRGKEGRVRGNLTGKRVDFSARSVITPDPLLGVGELGVPEFIALAITKNVPVNLLNLEEMQRCVAIGPGKLGGAASITLETGRRIHLDRRLPCPDVLPGMEVQCYLRNGDAVAFNRQPSLHKGSMMGMIIKILPPPSNAPGYDGGSMDGDEMNQHGNVYDTTRLPGAKKLHTARSDEGPFRLNLSATTPFNADFDGDEMNMHVPQNLAAEIELKELMLVDKQIVNSQSSKPIMGLVQDACTGAYLFSREDVFLTKPQACDLIMEITNKPNCSLPEPAILLPKPLWTGKQIFSLLLPNDFRFSRSVGSYEQDYSVALDTPSWPRTFVIKEWLVGQHDRVEAGAPLARVEFSLDDDNGTKHTKVVVAKHAGVFQSPHDLDTEMKMGSSIGSIVGTALNHNGPEGDTPAPGTETQEVVVGVVKSILHPLGSRVEVGDALVRIECAKDYFYLVRARHAGIVKKVHVEPGSPIRSMMPIADVRRDGAFDSTLQDHFVEVSDGEILRGHLKNPCIGRSTGSIVHRLFLDYGYRVAADFLSDAQRVINRWLTMRGFSVGLQDCVATSGAMHKARTLIAKTQNSVARMIDACRKEGFKEELVEPTVKNMLSRVLDEIGVAAGPTVRPNNRIRYMKDSGSKGSAINESQMMWCTGQQAVEGVRPSPKDGNTALLPSFSKGENTPEARGFIKRALSDGLNLREFFFYCMAGREGLTDTAVKTATIGYLERKLHKAMESLQFTHDGHVRNSSNQVVMDAFGDGSWDPAKLSKVALPFLRWSDAQVFAHLYLGDHEREADVLASPELAARMDLLKRVAQRRIEKASRGERLLASDGPDPVLGVCLSPEPEYIKLLRLRDRIRHTRLSGITPQMQDDCYLPFDAPKTIEEHLDKRRRRLSKPDGTAAAHPAVVPSEQEILKMVNDATEKLRSESYEALIPRMCLFVCFTTFNVQQKWCLSTEDLSLLLDKLVHRCQSARCDAGEMVGSIAAQSIGEPATQMTLNT